MPRRITRTFDPEFEAFRVQLRRDTARQRVAAVDALLAFVNRAPTTTDAPQARRDAAAFLAMLHRLAWLHTPNTVPPDRIEPEPRISPALVDQIHADMRNALLTVFPVGGKKYQRTAWRPPFQ